MFVYLILGTSAQALTVSIFTDSYRGKVKCQKKIHVQSIYSNLITKQAKKKVTFLLNCVPDRALHMKYLLSTVLN